MDQLDATKSADAISMLSKQFANFGIPEVLFSDNGPQFSSSEFKEFAKQLDFRHVTSSPGYPCSNGQVEWEIQAAKQTMMKMFEDGRTLWNVLQALKSTPVGGGHLSPAVLLQGQQLCTTMSLDTQALQPQSTDPTTYL